ncbi:MAG: hypothetical protein RBQ71_06345 [Acholeplasmataceae bacterium]|nr:hypothetical protein [Acholeplasmataceae bacterium]
MDKQYSKDLSMFFDTLRFERGLNQEDFVFDIISIRQYRRYLSGECKISQSIINQLSIKLGLKPEHIIFDFESARIEESKKITAFYNAVINKDYAKINEYDNVLDLSKIFDHSNRMLYQFAQYILQYRENKIHEVDLVSKIKEMINYPEILNMTRYSSAEVILMSNLLSYKSFHEKEKVSMKLLSFINDSKHVISGYNERIKFLCLQRLSDYQGIQGNFAEVIRLCKIAIDGLIQIKSYYLMDFFYYHLALAHFYLGNIDEHKESLYRCYCILHSEFNRAKIKKFVIKIEKDFPINFNNFIVEYSKEYIEKNQKDGL